MARSRTLKPDFFEDTTLANVDPLARLLYAGMWCWMDGQGLIEADARIHKRNIYPYDERITLDLVSKWIDQLVESGRLLRFQHNGKDLLFCPKLKNHSRIYNDEPRKFDVPEEKLSLVRTSSQICEVVGGTEKWYMKAEAAAEAAAEEECALNFSAIYELYPKRSGSQRKGEGIRALKVQLKTQNDLDECLRAARNYAEHCKLTKITGTQWVLMFKTWAGSVEDPKWREWIEWSPPLSESESADEWAERMAKEVGKETA